MAIALYLFGILAVFGILPCVLMVAAWNYLSPTYAWIVTVIVLVADGAVLWFRNPFRPSKD